MSGKKTWCRWCLVDYEVKIFRKNQEVSVNSLNKMRTSLNLGTCTMVHAHGNILGGKNWWESWNASPRRREVLSKTFFKSGQKTWCRWCLVNYEGKISRKSQEVSVNSLNKMRTSLNLGTCTMVHAHGNILGGKNWCEAWNASPRRREVLGSRVKSHVMCKFRREFVDRSNVGCHLEL